MNLLFSCIGRRGYLAGWFREALAPGDRIIGTTNTAWTPGLQACDRAILMPDLDDPAYLPTLLDVCRAERIDALLSFLDLDVDLIARNRDAFIAAGVTPVVPDAEASRTCLDKLETDRFLRRNGIGSPLTFGSLADALAALRDGTLRLPVIVKPRFGFASRHLFTANTEEQLRVLFDYAPDMLVQERVRGQEHSLDVLNDLQRRTVSVILKRKVLMRAGETDQSETVRHAGALAVGERLGAALGHVGPLDVDLFIDGETVTVLELNPRFGGAYPGSHLAGADFPRRIVAMLRGQPLEPQIGTHAVGVRMLKDYAILPWWEGDVLDRRGVAAETADQDQGLPAR